MLKNIPLEQRTREVCRQYVDQDISQIEFVPKAVQDDELFRAWLEIKLSVERRHNVDIKMTHIQLIKEGWADKNTWAYLVAKEAREPSDSPFDIWDVQSFSYAVKGNGSAFRKLVDHIESSLGKSPKDKVELFASKNPELVTPDRKVNLLGILNARPEVIRFFDDAAFDSIDLDAMVKLAPESLFYIQRRHSSLELLRAVIANHEFQSPLITMPLVASPHFVRAYLDVKGEQGFKMLLARISNGWCGALNLKAYALLYFHTSAILRSNSEWFTRLARKHAAILMDRFAAQVESVEAFCTQALNGEILGVHMDEQDYFFCEWLIKLNPGSGQV